MAATEWGKGPKERYPSDLTDEEWAILKPFVPAKVKGDGRRGRPTKVNLREVCNAIFYQTQTGCQWRALPSDLPNHNDVYYYFAKWRDDGTWEQINQALAKRHRVEADGRQAEPTGAILDSQSVKTTSMGGERGYDGGKKGEWSPTVHLDGHGRQFIEGGGVASVGERGWGRRVAVPIGVS